MTKRSKADTQLSLTSARGFVADEVWVYLLPSRCDPGSIRRDRDTQVQRACVTCGTEREPQSSRRRWLVFGRVWDWGVDGTNHG